MQLLKNNKCFIYSNHFNLKEAYEQDQESITKTFSTFNFDVANNINTNLTANEMKTSIKQEVFDRDYSKEDCVVLFFLSHGDEGGKIYGDDKEFIEVDWVVDGLQDTPSLHGKPKIVFIQVHMSYMSYYL